MHCNTCRPLGEGNYKPRFYTYPYLRLPSGSSCELVFGAARLAQNLGDWSALDGHFSLATNILAEWFNADHLSDPFLALFLARRRRSSAVG